MKHNFTIKEEFTASPEVIYAAWLDSDKHSDMTGGEAECSDQIGESFTAWDGYIQGTNQELLQDQKIVQKWRTTEFADGDDDSEIIILFNASPEGTTITLTHHNIPEGQPDYETGWVEHYFNPMKEYFN